MAHMLMRRWSVRILQVERTDASWHEIHDGERLVAAWTDPKIALDYALVFLQRRRTKEAAVTGRELGGDHRVSPAWGLN